MSCTNGCPETNDQYTCGCINPTTFICNTYTGVELEHLDIAPSDEDLDGDTVLGKINTAVGALASAKGKVLINGADTCPEYLSDKLSAGSNISFTVVGTGCDRTLRIDAVEGGTPVDVNVKITEDDTVSGYLYSKIAIGKYTTKAIKNVGANETIEIDVNPTNLISTDSGNLLSLGTDHKLKTSFTAPNGSETKIVAGTGISKTGIGTDADPFVISANGFIQSARSCFDGVWRSITLEPTTGTSNVTRIAGDAKYRIRYDGTMEFKGALTFNVSFGTYESATRKYTITIGSIPTTCLSLSEQAGVSDLKSINYIDALQASADQIVQQYGYIIRKSNQNIVVEFQSSFSSTTQKTLVVNFDGAASHPNL